MFDLLLSCHQRCVEKIHRFLFFHWLESPDWATFAAVPTLDYHNSQKNSIFRNRATIAATVFFQYSGCLSLAMRETWRPLLLSSPENAICLAVLLLSEEQIWVKYVGKDF